MKINTRTTTLVNKINILLLLLLLCLSFTTATQATQIAGVEHYNNAVDLSDIDSSEKNDQVDDDNAFVAFTLCQLNQFKLSLQVPGEASGFIANAFIRPLTRAPPKVNF